MALLQNSMFQAPVQQRVKALPEVFKLRGLVSGPYIDSKNVLHGFVRTRLRVHPDF